jgi:hypothetical protein
MDALVMATRTMRPLELRPQETPANNKGRATTVNKNECEMAQRMSAVKRQRATLMTEQSPTECVRACACVNDRQYATEGGPVVRTAIPSSACPCLVQQRGELSVRWRLSDYGTTRPARLTQPRQAVWLCPPSRVAVMGRATCVCACACVCV